MANFAILRTGKLKSAASVNGMLKHNFRKIDTPNANPEQTPSNEHWAAVSVNDGMKRYRDRLPRQGQVKRRPCDRLLGDNIA